MDTDTGSKEKTEEPWKYVPKEVVIRLLEGDNEAAQAAMEQLLPFAKRLSRRFIAARPFAGLDIRAASFLGVAKAIRRIQQKKIKIVEHNIMPYVNSIIRWTITDQIRHDRMIYVPHDAWLSIVKSIGLKELSDYDRLRFEKEITTRFCVFLHREDAPEDTRPVKDPDTVSYNELLEHLQLTKYEERIVELRMKCYTLREIGSVFGVSEAAIRKTLAKVQARYRIIQRAHPTFLAPPEE